ncbi:hypothetical protein AB1K70_05060 [Bremerella sp. JC770]|uniref:hypothetical protein n=1 Tax=Bremerella sp. JC770 TaxID=3232137 RepID=UPI0034574C61
MTSSNLHYGCACATTYMLLCLEYDQVTMQQLSSEEERFVLDASRDAMAQEPLEKFTGELLELEPQLLPDDGRFGDLHQRIADSFDVEFAKILKRAIGDERVGVARFFARQVTFYSCAVVFATALQEVLQQAEQPDEQFKNLIEIASALQASLPGWLDQVGRKYQLPQDVIASNRDACQTDDFVRNASELWHRYLEWTIRIYDG